VLEEMRIRGLGVIDDATLELGPGFTVVTGETGAGKTMVVSGLGLLLGGRADAGAVRTGTSSAVVEGRLVVGSDSAVAARAVEAGAALDDDVLVVTRSVSVEGRSRAHLGGRAVPVAVLSELAEALVAVHGQSDQRRLLQPARQRATLDRFAGEEVAGPAARYGEAYDRLDEVERELAATRTSARERAQEADLLRFGLDEVAATEPRPGEDLELEAEENRLAHADALRSAATSAHRLLVGDDTVPDAAVDAGTALAAARQSLGQASGHDPDLAGLAERVAEAGYLVADVAADLASYAAAIDADPVRLAAVAERHAALRHLTRKFGPTVDDVLSWAKQAAERLAGLDGDGERLAALESERAALREALSGIATELTSARERAATRFGEAVTAELADLAMPAARVELRVDQRADTDGLDVHGRRVAFGRHGVDDVELLLAGHAGAPLRPLQKGASGGELSRVMLAVEVVFAGADPLPTFVFDEVDAGVGGRAGAEIGRRLARLARTAQVLVVTHLPQVAAYADRHLLVAKSAEGSVTSSGVTLLDDAGRARELARMLAGQEGSRSGLAHARELLRTARDGRDRP